MLRTAKTGFARLPALRAGGLRPPGQVRIFWPAGAAGVSGCAFSGLHRGQVRAAGPAVLRTAKTGFARLPALRAGGLRPFPPLPAKIPPRRTAGGSLQNYLPR